MLGTSTVLYYFVHLLLFLTFSQKNKSIAMLVAINVIFLPYLGWNQPTKSKKKKMFFSVWRQAYCTVNHVEAPPILMSRTWTSTDKERKTFIDVKNICKILSQNWASEKICKIFTPWHWDEQAHLILGDILNSFSLKFCSSILRI